MGDMDRIFGIYDVDYPQLNLSIDKPTIKDIQNGKEVKTTMYYRNFASENGAPDGTRRDLILCLNGSQDTRIEGISGESEEVKLLFSRKLLDTLLDTKDKVAGGPDYTTKGDNSIHIYVNDSMEKFSLNLDFQSYEKSFGNKK